MPDHVLQITAGLPRGDGCGVMIDCLARAGGGKWEQHLLHASIDAAGGSARGNAAAPGNLPADRVHRVNHGAGGLNFALPVLRRTPFPSMPFEQISATELRSYRLAWERAIGRLIEQLKPVVIHTHHLWLTTAIAQQQAARRASHARIVAHCYGDELKLFHAMPEIAAEVWQACQQCDRILVHDEATAARVAALTGASAKRVRVAPNGARGNCFFPPEQPADTSAILYCGPLAQAGGLAWLLDAVEQNAATTPSVR